MFKKFTISAITATAVLLTPVSRATAGNNLAAGIAGAIIGGALVSAANQRKKKVNRSSNYSGQRQENREVQTSLNYFSFPAGTPDGVFGRKTRAAVSSYQLYMGYPVTGRLTEFQKTVLLTSYQRALAGGQVVAQIIGASPDGTRGMLKNTQQQMAGGATVMAAAPQVVVQPQTVYVQPAQPVTTQQPQVVAAAQPDSGDFTMPNFSASQDNANSMANHCNKISLITNTNGGFTNVSTMQDPVFALNEQFCLARIYAISKSEEMISRVQGISAAQMQTQCETLGPAFKEQVASLSLGQREDVITKTGEMILSSGMSPAQLTHTAKICLGIGYRTDNADVALASTLILVTLGEPVYGELLGHHLINGFGTSQRNDLAIQWYASANNALEMGMPAVFVPGQTNRPALIKTAVARLNTPSPATAATPAPQTTGFVVPTFGSNN